MIKISQALQAQKAISAEIAHLRSLETRQSWSYRSLDTPNAELTPNFDFEANHEKIKKLSRIHTKLGLAIARTNLQLDVVGLSEKDFVEISEWV